MRSRVASALRSRVASALRSPFRAYTQQVCETTPLLAMGTEWENRSRANEEINQHPLKQNAVNRLNRELKAGISDEQLAKLVTVLHRA